MEKVKSSAVSIYISMSVNSRMWSFLILKFFFVRYVDNLLSHNIVLSIYNNYVGASILLLLSAYKIGQADNL